MPTGLIVSPCDITLLTTEKELAARVLCLRKVEESILLQRSKQDYIKLGDSNNKFFYSCLASRQTKNHIHSLTAEDGSRVIDAEQITSLILDFYQHMLGSSGSVAAIEEDIFLQCPILTTDQGTKLLSIPPDEEIKSAIWSIPDFKAPGPDGFSSGFYKKVWRIVGADVCVAIRDFF